MTAPKTTLIQLDIYSTGLYLLVGGDKEGIKRWIERELDGYDSIDVGDPLQSMGVFTKGRNKKTGHTAYVLWLAPARRNNESLADIAHECLHATVGILRGKGIRLTNASEESFTYLLDHIFKRVLDTMDKKKLWKR